MRLVLSLIVLAFGVLGCANSSYSSLNEPRNTHTKYVKVEKYVRVYDDVYEDIPYEDCYDKKVKIYEQNQAPNPGAVIVGSVVGGLLGNKLSRKSHHRFNRRAATIGGVALGGVLGGALSSKHQRKDSNSYEIKRVCERKYRQQKRRVLAGYDNIGYYDGMEIVKFSTQKLRQIPVRISIDY